MRRLIVPLTLLLGLVPAVAAPPAVKFPEVVSPAPMPSAVATLTKGRLFVVESKEKVTILSSPDGLVEVMERKGPFSVYSKFADGPDEEQFRTFDGPFVFILRPVKSGECELLVIPETVKGKDDVIRRQLKVDAGEGPRPPPKPMDLELVKRSDAVLRLPGESSGADGEVDYARLLGIPVFHSVAEVVEHFRAG